jgi:radical SAM protein with 4Fe4S-binding SPASM domain
MTPPKIIYVKTTGTCNLDCQHCFTGGKNGDRTQFDPDVAAAWIKEFIAKYPPDTHTHLELHGGEPFMVPLPKLQQFTHHFQGFENVSICANSNLTFRITPAILDFIKVDLDSQIGTSWDHWIRWPTPEKYELWRSNLELLRAEGVHIGLKVSVSRQLIDSSPRWFLDQMDALAVDTIALERITAGGSSVINMNVFPDNEAQDNWYLELLKLYQQGNHRCKISTLDTLLDKIRLGMVKVDTNCRNCEQHLVTMNSDGTLGGCPNVASERNYANVHQPVDEFLYSEDRLTEITKELDFGDCVHCDVFDLCGGDCHQLAWQGKRCGGLKNTLRYISGRDTQSNLILKV